MRKFTSTQADSSKTPFLGVTPIEDVWLDPNCRDEVTKILRGLQEIYRNKALLSRIEIILNSLFEDKSKDKGRQGMDLWVVFILGMLRVGCNWDFDRLKSCYDNHHKVREIAGVDLFCDAEMVTGRQTIHDNVSLLTPNVLSELNKSIVDFGHEHLFPSTKDLDTRCDSFVFLTNVHFPTDFNLLLDCLRKIINALFWQRIISSVLGENTKAFGIKFVAVIIRLVKCVILTHKKSRLKKNDDRKFLLRFVITLQEQSQ